MPIFLEVNHRAQAKHIPRLIRNDPNTLVDRAVRENHQSLQAIMNETVLLIQAEDGIRDVERSRGLGDVYKRQNQTKSVCSGS